jgi:hypothetical protein
MQNVWFAMASRFPAKLRLEPAPPTPPPPPPTWARVAIAVAILSLAAKMAWDLWAVGIAFQAFVSRFGPPAPPTAYTLILVFCLIRAGSSYVALAALWYRRAWAPRAIVAAGVVDVAILVMTFLYFHPSPLLLPPAEDWRAFGALNAPYAAGVLTACGLVAVIASRALASLPAATRGSARPMAAVSKRSPVRWLYWAAGIPPALFILLMLRPAVGGLGLGSGNPAAEVKLKFLVMLSLPLFLLVLKAVLDRVLRLTPSDSLHY